MEVVEAIKKSFPKAVLDRLEETQLTKEAILALPDRFRVGHYCKEEALDIVVSNEPKISDWYNFDVEEGMEIEKEFDEHTRSHVPGFWADRDYYHCYLNLKPYKEAFLKALKE